MEFNSKRFHFLVRFFLAGWLLLYGVCKLLGIQLEQMDVHGLINDVDPNVLMWYFFGLSPLYAKFIGLSQVVSATFLLLPKTKTIGVLLVTPIIANILVLNFAFNITYFTIVLSILLLAVVFI